MAVQFFLKNELDVSYTQIATFVNSLSKDFKISKKRAYRFFHKYDLCRDIAKMVLDQVAKQDIVQEEHHHILLLECIYK